MGRRRAVWLGAAIMCIATAIQTASPSVGMFIGARFLVGFGLTFAGQFRQYPDTQSRQLRHIYSKRRSLAGHRNIIPYISRSFDVLVQFPLVFR